MNISNTPTENTDQTIRKKLDAEAGRSNTIVAEHEKKIIRDLLSDAQQSLDELDLEIARVEASLMALRRKRQKAVSRMTRFRVALSSEKLFPPELLSRIFVLSLPDNSVHLRHGHYAVPWIYLRVCSRWRQVILNEHRLWNKLITNASPNLTKAWLQLLWSQNPTSLVSLDFKESNRSAELYDIVSVYAPRPLALSIAGRGKTPFEYMANPPLPFDRLERITLKWENFTPPKLPVIASKSVPNLRCVELIAEHETLYDRKLDLPWSQLTILIFTHVMPTITIMHSILSRCPRLTHFTVGMGLLQIVPNILIPALTDLNLALGNFNASEGFFQRLIMPSLKNLSFRYDTPSRPPPRRPAFPQSEFLDMLEGSTAIETLILGCRFTHLNLVTMLKKMPCLTKLIVDTELPFPGEIFDMMKVGALLPQLGWLECTTAFPHSVLDLLQQQCSYPDLEQYRGLRWVHVTYTGQDDTIAVRKRLQALGPQLRCGNKTVTFHRKVPGSFVDGLFHYDRLETLPVA